MATRGTKWQGSVEGANDKGLKLDGEWKNYSQYFEGTRAQKGDTIVAVIDGKWINSLDVVGSARQGASESHGAASQGTSSAGVDWEAKDRHIRRQVALKASVETAGLIQTGSKPAAKIEVTVEGIIEVARQFEAYLNEPVRAEEDPEELPY